MFLGAFNASANCWYPSQDLYLNKILSRSSADNSFDLMAWFLLCHALPTVRPYTDRCAFLNHIQSIEFSTGRLQSSCRNISRMINGNRMHLSSISSLIAKGLNTYVNKVFLFFICNTFAKVSVILFPFRHYGVLCVD